MKVMLASQVKANTFLPNFPWPGLSHLDTPSCKAAWEVRPFVPGSTVLGSRRLHFYDRMKSGHWLVSCFVA